MKYKKQDEKSVEELVKIVVDFRVFMTNLVDELAKALADIKAPKEEDTWEIKCPYKIGDEYYYVYGDGCVRIESWDNFSMEISRWRSGNTFPTKEGAELEAKRRNLLTRFRAFRNECNEGWIPSWRGVQEVKAYIQYHTRFNKFVIKYTLNCDVLQTFGFFKCKQDAERAIELFGDEIKRLYVEVE